MRIPLLDDDLGEPLTHFLTEPGHEVEVTVDGDEAFRLYCGDGDFDIVISDIDHPGMSAVDLQKAIFAKNPRQMFAFITGYPILQKPFTKEQFLHSIDQMKPKSSATR
jgi:DNA-binding NtrC family response regulator